MNVNYGIGLFFMLLLLLNSCAEPGQLTGGPRDKTPPGLDSTRYSTPNYQTNFQEREIILTFDEWVVLKNAFTQVLISPPLEERPEIFTKHKSVVFRFNEPLIENTTYTIQFGESVVDYTEGNPAKNLRFVFSTGDKLDSLMVRGQIVDAISNKGKGDVWVMLYDQLGDSTPIKERPLYVTKTDKNGQFQFENIREDSFRLFALDDQNSNYQFDQVQESVAFYEEIFHLTDSMKGAFKLRMFEEDPDLIVQKKEQEFKNELVITFNKKVEDSVVLRPLFTISNNFEFIRELNGKRLRYWWKGAPEEWKLLIEVPTVGLSDTADLVMDEEMDYRPWDFAKEEVDESAGKSKGGGKVPQAVAPQPFYKTTSVDLTRPIAQLDTSKLALLDSAKQAVPVQWTSKGRRLELGSQAKPAAYQLIIYPGGITDFFGQSNKDTLQKELISLGEDELGNIVGSIVNADSSKQYIVQLVDAKDQVLAEELMVNKKELKLAYPNRIPQQYFIQVIHDENGDGKWTNGKYILGRQPETITRSNAIKLRANWDNDVEIDLDPGAGKKGKK